ncbi:hypothetical protein ACHAW6_008886 [Cyclotella cf. meneghiniana]
MTNQSSAKTLKAKQAYEHFACKQGVRICHYHCYNGSFVDNAFKQHAEQQQQTLTNCGIPVTPLPSLIALPNILLNKPETIMSSNWQIGKAGQCLNNRSDYPAMQSCLDDSR